MLQPLLRFFSLSSPRDPARRHPEQPPENHAARDHRARRREQQPGRRGGRPEPGPPRERVLPVSEPWAGSARPQLRVPGQRSWHLRVRRLAARARRCGLHPRVLPAEPDQPGAAAGAQLQTGHGHLAGPSRIGRAQPEAARRDRHFGYGRGRAQL